ncbi:MAG: PEP/pyruvate-binding domain-containing protein, partial [Propionicimonas sp.]|nr:PEP/pyruvate-binding domain-containing protein [Propionicimonas sp.]
MPTIVWLEEVDAGDLALAGGKGANLGELVRAGFDVPRGFVVTTQAHARRNPDGSVPAVVADDIRSAWRELVGDTGARVAVRSSATAEDLAEASFAGQQETYLGVAGEDAVVAAVADCWASLFGERAVAYRTEHEVAESGLAMAVVVQLMVDADAAGVMFTANPVNGHREQVVLTASWGLGESVVGGLVDPDTVVVDTAAQRVVERETGDKASRIVLAGAGTRTEQLAGDAWGAAVLDDGQALALAALGRRVEAHFARPQDIEWALDSSGFHVLQARPVTALPDRVESVPDTWPSEPGNMYFRASIIEQLPEPLTPLFADLMAEAVPASLQALMNDLATESGLPEDTFSGLDVGFPTVNGYAFYRYANSAMARVTSSSLGAVRLLYARGGQLFLDRWRNRGLPEYRAAVAAWAGRDLAAVPPRELLGGVGELLAAGCRYYTFVQTIIPLTGTVELSWHALYRALAGVDRGPVESYIIGLDSEPLRAEQELWELGRWVGSDDRLAAAVRQPGFEPGGAAPDGVPGEVWQEWLTRF